MSHTNSTPNYNLPQFVGTDKPTWLNDVNGAMSAIDTQMKANADSATTAGTKATTAINTVGTLANLETTAKTDLVSAVNEVNTNVGTAQGTANTAIGKANDTLTALQTFMSLFNLTNITQGNDNNYTKTGTVNNNLTLAQDSTGAIFKCYGGFYISPSSSVTRTAIAGMSGTYGVDTGLVLTTSPSEAYVIKNAGDYKEVSGVGINRWGDRGLDIVVGTNGHIYIFNSTSSTNVTTDNTYGNYNHYFPCIYFNTTFGDTPSPEPNA